MRVEVFCLVVFLASLGFSARAQAPASTSENILVEVKHVGKDENGHGEESILKVSLHVVTQNGIVHVNGKRMNHTVVNALHTRVELDQYSTSGVLLRHARAKIQVRVLITEGKDAATNAKILTVQEEIVEVNRQLVTQVDVKEVVMHLDVGNMEIKRVVTTVAIMESRIHSIPRKMDHHCYHRRHHAHGRLPHPPLYATKKDMRYMTRQRVPTSHLRPPHFPDHPMRGGKHLFEDDDDDEDDDGYGDYDEDEGRHHRYRGKKFCKWFHRLPAGVRVVMIIGVVFTGLVVLTCCVRCCRRRSSRAYDVPSKVAPKVELYDDEEIDEAGPLPVKTSLDKAQLIVT